MSPGCAPRPPQSYPGQDTCPGLLGPLHQRPSCLSASLSRLPTLSYCRWKTLTQQHTYSCHSPSRGHCSKHRTPTLTRGPRLCMASPLADSTASRFVPLPYPVPLQPTTRHTRFLPLCKASVSCPCRLPGGRGSLPQPHPQHLPCNAQDRWHLLPGTDGALCTFSWPQ